ncbi:uncharacterized protein LOC127835732 [Dreissena polymorpha]|uniref:uncharacterized protein LOC127835732 n=1 Tax=Dreissena polymorpha TaxID=45954 RepID=UPI00226568F4|nr:uncharacterized protein LOC127835732 [Dreissena polymorpha]
MIECPDVSILLGSRIVFECDFSQNEDVKSQWNNTEWTRTEVDYPPSNVNKSDMLCNKLDTGFVMRCESDYVTRATCSNNGKITLTLKTMTGFVTYSTSFAMSLQEWSIRASTPIANNASGSVVVRCSVSGVCKSYKMHIYAYETDTKKTRIDGPQFNCESTFNDTNGHRIACKDEIKGDDIRKGKKKVTCALTDVINESIEQETEIQFPICCEKKVQSEFNCEAVCRNCTGQCPYCNEDIWCRTGTGTFITDKDSSFEICETINTIKCAPNAG